MGAALMLVSVMRAWPMYITVKGAWLVSEEYFFFVFERSE